MTDPNDSDGSWEFVDKDTDSETSSVALPYDTGLPDENSQNDDLIGSAWNNQDDFITDSDIEACADDPVESDEEEATIVQAAAQMSGSEHDEIRSSLTDSGEDYATKSMLAYEEENSPQRVDEIEPLLMEESTREEDTKLQNDNMTLSCTDGNSIEEVTSQETVDASFSDDIIPPPHIDSDHIPTTEDIESRPTSIASSESDFERIASAPDLTISDLTFEPGSVETIGNEEEETTVMKTVDDAPPSDQSDAGSVDFTVISAPSSPPVEIVSHDTETSILANQRSVGMVTENPWPNQEMVGVGTDSKATNQRTVGMVTEYLAPPNQRLLISIIMISFGVGFLIGRCPIPSSTVLSDQKDHYAPLDKFDAQETPQSIQHIYHGDDSQGEEPESVIIEDLQLSLRQARAGNDFARYKLLAENTKLRYYNRGLRSTIRKLRERNEKIAIHQLLTETNMKEVTMAFNILQQSCQRQQRLHEMKVENKDKELKQLKDNVAAADRDNVFLNRSMNLYRRLQVQHTALMKLYEYTAESHIEEKVKSAAATERYNGLKLRLQRYRGESKKLLQQLAQAKTHNTYLKMLAEQNDVLRQAQLVKKLPLDSKRMSPFLRALTVHGRTCHAKSKFQTQVKYLKIKVKDQSSSIRKLEQEGHLKSMALEILYNSFGELTNYATCLTQQFEIPPLERARDVPAFCRSTQKAAPMHVDQRTNPTPKFGPQCSYPINGTLTLDFSSINITVNSFSDDDQIYEIKLLTDSVRPTLFFNATTMTTDLTSTCDMTFKPNMTSGPINLPQFVPKALYTDEVKKSERTGRKLETKKAEFVELRKVCAANNRSLEVSRKKAQKMENKLTAVRTELKLLRLERKNLNKKLRNATVELKMKSSFKQCLKSALDTEEILDKINGTKAYKGASKMAEKVKKATKKAWRKMKNFMSKFNKKLNHRDFDDDDDVEKAPKSHETKKDGHSEFDEDVKKAHKSRETKKDHCEFDDDVKKDHKSHETKKAHREFDDDVKKAHKFREMKKDGRLEFDDDVKKAHKSHEVRKDHREFDEKSEHKKGEKRRQIYGPLELGKNKKAHKIHKNRDTEDKRPHDHVDMKHHGDFEKSDENHENKKRRNCWKGRHENQENEKQQEKEQKERKFSSQKPRLPKNSQKVKNHEKEVKKERKNEEKYFFNHRYEKQQQERNPEKVKLEIQGPEMEPKFSRDTHQIPDREPQRSEENQHRRGKRSHRFHEVVKKHVDKVKEAGEKVVYHLMPIYDKWQKVYCDIEKKILPKSFTEIWDSLGQDGNNKDTDADIIREEDSETVDTNWGLGLFQNFTELLMPVIELPGKIEIPAWGVDLHKNEWVAPTTRRDDSLSQNGEKLVGPPDGKIEKKAEEDLNIKDGKDPQWFLHMFRAREGLRKDGRDSPLSEEEFDWFLRMFDAREQLRQSGNVAYPGYHGNEDEMDWFLKMFEARAQLRFKNTEDEKNWYLKMSEARKRARSEIRDQGSNVKDWYQMMFKARENMRDQHDDNDHKMAEERPEVDHNGPNEEWCLA